MNVRDAIAAVLADWDSDPTSSTPDVATDDVLDVLRSLPASERSEAVAFEQVGVLCETHGFEANAPCLRNVRPVFAPKGVQ